MNTIKPIRLKKVVIALLMVGVTQIALGSFTGTSDKKSSSLFSLKSFNKNFYKSSSPFSLRAGFDYKGLRVISQKKEANGDLTFNSMMRFEKGNTTYIYPYQHKVSVSKFKTPAPPAFR